MLKLIEVRKYKPVADLFSHFFPGGCLISCTAPPRTKVESCVWQPLGQSVHSPLWPDSRALRPPCTVWAHQSSEPISPAWSRHTEWVRSLLLFFAFPGHSPRLAGVATEFHHCLLREGCSGSGWTEALSKRPWIIFWGLVESVIPHLNLWGCLDEI